MYRHGALKGKIVVTANILGHKTNSKLNSRTHLELTTDKPEGQQGTAGRILKINHAGEFGAVNIYRAQIAIVQFYDKALAKLLRDFLAHEKEHLRIFGSELERRGVRRCRSYYLCGIGGFCLGFITAAFGKNSVLACTAAVESVVLKHLAEQVEALKIIDDMEAVEAIESIIADEKAHHDEGVSASTDCIFYKPFVKVVQFSTECVIWLGMKL